MLERNIVIIHPELNMILGQRDWSLDPSQCEEMSRVAACPSVGSLMDLAKPIKSDTVWPMEGRYPTRRSRAPTVVVPYWTKSYIHSYDAFLNVNYNSSYRPAFWAT